MSVLGCSRFGTIKDQATEDSSAILIGEPFEQSRSLVWFERRRGHGAVKLVGRGLPGRILWKCAHKLSSACRDVTTMPEPTTASSAVTSAAALSSAALKLSTVLAATARRAVLIFDQHGSMGEKSGEQ